MKYRTYKVRGVNSTSGRSKGVTVSAHTEIEAIILGKEKGLIDPVIEEIIEISEPSERQIEYAKDLGISIPADANIEDVSALISRNLEDDYDPDIGLVEFAESFRLKFSKFIGNRSLCDLLFYELEGEDKSAFFVFQIYKQLVNEESTNLNFHPEKSFMYHIGNKILERDDLLRSMEKYDGRQLAFFGEKTINGWERTGGSQNTKAYRYVSESISNYYRTKKTKKSLELNTNNYLKANSSNKKIDSSSKFSKKEGKENNPDKEILLGCFGTLIIFLIIYFLVF